MSALPNAPAGVVELEFRFCIGDRSTEDGYLLQMLAGVDSIDRRVQDLPAPAMAAATMSSAASATVESTGTVTAAEGPGPSAASSK